MKQAIEGKSPTYRRLLRGQESNSTIRGDGLGDGRARSGGGSRGTSGSSRGPGSSTSSSAVILGLNEFAVDFVVRAFGTGRRW